MLQKKVTRSIRPHITIGEVAEFIHRSGRSAKTAATQARGLASPLLVFVAAASTIDANTIKKVKIA